MRRGDIFVCDFGDPIGHEQGYQRPALIVSADQTVEYGLPVVAPISRTRLEYPTHVELDGALPVTCYVQCEQIRVVSAQRLVKKVGSVDGVDMIRIETIVRRLLAL